MLDRLLLVLTAVALGMPDCGVMEAAEPSRLEYGDYVLPGENCEVRSGGAVVSLRGRNLPLIVQSVDGDDVNLGIGQVDAASLVPLSDAEAYYAAWLARDPNAVDAFHLRACARMALERYAEAVDDFTGAIAIAPGSARLHTKRAYAYLILFRLDREARHAEASIRDADAALRLDPNEVWALCNKGFVLLELSKPEAQTHLRRAKSMTPPDELSYFHRSGVCAYLNDRPGAVRDLDAALLLNPCFEQAYLHRAAYHDLLGISAKSDADVEHALRVSPKSPRAWMSRALNHYDKNQLPQALEGLAKAAALGPDDGEVWMAYTTTLLGIKDEAFRNPQLLLRAALRAVELQPKYFRANYSLARAYGEAGDFAKALASMETAKSLREHRRYGDAPIETIDGWISFYRTRLGSANK